MKTFDVESFLLKFRDKMKEQLNVKIAAINTEKGDTLLSLIDNDAWIIGSLNDRIKNYKDFVFGFVDDVASEVNGMQVKEEITLEFDLFISCRVDGYDADGVDNDEKRILRYWRALKDAAVETWGVVGLGYDYAQIKSLVPIDVKMNDSAYYQKLCGVSVTFAINS